MQKTCARKGTNLKAADSPVPSLVDHVPEVARNDIKNSKGDMMRIARKTMVVAFIAGIVGLAVSKALATIAFFSVGIAAFYCFTKRPDQTLSLISRKVMENFS